MITVEVLAEKGWRNGDKSYKQGAFVDLECDQDRIQAYIDEGILKIAGEVEEKDKIDPDKIEQTNADVIAQAVVKAVCAIQAEHIPPIVVRDRVEDDPKGGFKTFSQFAQAVYLANKPDVTAAADRVKCIAAKKRLDAYGALDKATGEMAEGDNPQGGYLVPTEFRANLWQTSLENAVVRPRATFVPMATNSIKFPALADYDHRESGSGLFGALKIYRPGEAEEKTASKPEFEQITLTLHKNVAYTYVSDELIEDSAISIEPLLTTLFGKAIAWHEDNDYINGLGANQPLGALNGACLISVTREECHAGYLSYTDVVNMWARMHPASHNDSVWLINQALLPYLLRLCYSCVYCDDGGDSGITGTAAYLPPGGASDSPYGTLLGRPVIVTEHCPSLGNVGDILLADWSQYLIGGKAGMSVKMDSSIHLRFNYDQTAFRAVLRNDGQPWWSAALVPKHTVSDLTTNNTLSPFVALSVHSSI